MNFSKIYFIAYNFLKTVYNNLKREAQILSNKHNQFKLLII